MGDIPDMQPQLSRTLQAAIDAWGQTLVMETLGATPVQLHDWLLGRAEMDEHLVGRLAGLANAATPPDAQSDATQAQEVQVSGPVRSPDVDDMGTGNTLPCGSYDGDKDRETMGDLVGMGGIDPAQTGDLAQPIDVAPSQPNLRHPDLKDTISRLWTARQHAVVAQMGSRNAREHVIALEWQVELELVLIEQFNQCVPDPDVTWDEGRRAREIETRINRLRWAKEELRQSYGGILGFLKRLVFIRRPTRHQLYQFALRKQQSLMNDVEHGGRS